MNHEHKSHDESWELCAGEERLKLSEIRRFIGIADRIDWWGISGSEYLMNIPEILLMEETLHHLGCVKPCE